MCGTGCDCQPLIDRLRDTEWRFVLCRHKQQAVKLAAAAAARSTAATHAHFKKRSQHGLSCARLIAHLAASTNQMY
eukprot:scaffold34327_cov157-Isochrysis_galbana.AAC.1